MLMARPATVMEEWQVNVVVWYTPNFIYRAEMGARI